MRCENDVLLLALTHKRLLQIPPLGGQSMQTMDRAFAATVPPSVTIQKLLLFAVKFAPRYSSNCARRSQPTNKVPLARPRARRKEGRGCREPYRSHRRNERRGRLELRVRDARQLRAEARQRGDPLRLHKQLLLIDDLLGGGSGSEEGRVRTRE